MRTQKTIVNMLSDIIPFFLMGLLGFVKIRVFVNYLGRDYYGFTQLFSQIFNYLNLAEAGFGTAIVFALYFPIAEKNRVKVNQLLSGARVIFNKIGLVIIAFGFILSFFVSSFIKDNPMEPFMTQIAFLIFLATSVGNYFVFAPRFLIQADQNKYLISLSTNITRIIQILVEIILLIMGFDLITIFIWYFIVMLINNVIINKLAYKKYPWLDIHRKADVSTITNTKHVFVYRIGTIISQNTDSIVLSAFIGLDAVAIYASYNYITAFIISITTKIIESSQDSFGNFFAARDKEEGISSFREMNSFLFFISSVVFTVTYISMNDFISLWLGENMIVSQFTVLLFCIVFFSRVMRGSQIVIINGVGAFKDIKWLSLLEGIVNIILSLALVRKYGIGGVLVATIISYAITGFWFIPKYIYNKVFNQRSFLYFREYLINVLIIAIIILPASKFCQIAGFYQDTQGLVQWFKDSLLFTLLMSLLYFAIYYGISHSFRQIIKRLANTLLHK